MENTLIFLQKLLKITSNIPLSSISCDKQSLRKILQDAANPDDNEIALLWQQLTTTKKHTFSACNLPNNALILMIPLRTRNTIIVLGPVVTVPTESSSLPFAEYHTLYEIADLLCQHAFDFSASSVFSAEPSLLRHSFPAGGDIAQMRQVEQRYEYSAALTNAVQQGNLSLALHMIGQYDPGTKTTVRNTNPLRNAQNYCIVLNTQLRHALEKSGIHPYQVDRLSNEIGIEIEKLKNVSQLPEFFSGVIRRYCRLVQEHAYPNLKPLTNLAVTYIKEHLADNLTVKDTAKALTINANYLSTLFHKDMGMTFIDFVNKERTSQAAALIRHTNLQIQQIASTVGYNNTSYFAKQFVRFQGVSPSHYRRKI